MVNIVLVSKYLAEVNFAEKIRNTDLWMIGNKYLSKNFKTDFDRDVVK